MPLPPLIRVMRPAFLALTPACVLLGVAVSLYEQPAVPFRLVVLVLAGALAAHVGVNALNEYHDFRSGLDLRTARTPFSGGSGALVEHPALAGRTLWLALAALGLAALIGVHFLQLRGLLIAPIGLLGLALCAAYTPWINRLPLLCLIAPGLGFGVLMVVGTQIALTGFHTPLGWLVALVPFFLVNNLLLLNQYPDRAADAAAGRNNLVIAFGVATASRVYGVFVLAAYALIAVLVWAGVLPRLGLLALLPLGTALWALAGAGRHGEAIGAFPHYLAANVAAAVATPLLLALALLRG